MQRITNFLIILLGINSLCFCTNSKNSFIKIEGEAQGTTYHISYRDKENRIFTKEIEQIFKSIDNSMSTWNQSSLISRINRNETSQIDDQDFARVLKRSLEISDKSEGAFDITVAPLVNAWGFGFSKKEKVTPQLIDSLLKLVDYKHIKVKNNYIVKENSNSKIDLNAIAQGYTVDKICQFLERNGIDNYLVEVGGEVRVKGKNAEEKNWTIGIEKPLENADTKNRSLQGKVILKDQALATSGNYRKFYEINGVKYAHTIDPKTGYPVTHSLLSVSVIADNCMDADAFATTFMVMGLQKSLAYLENDRALEAYFIYSDENGQMRTYATSGFKKYMKI